MRWKTGYSKFLVTALLVAVLLLLVDFERFAAHLQEISLLTISLAAVGYALTQIISASKWYLLMRSAGISITLFKAVRIFFIGMYVNAFCFGTIGGDLTRALLASGGRERSLSLATVIVDRALGLSVLACIGLAAGLVFGTLSSQPIIAAAAALVIVTALIGWKFAPNLLTFASGRMPHIAHKFERLKDAFPHRSEVLIKSSSLALLYHLSQIFLIGLIIRELGGEVPLNYLLFAVPFINIAGTLPLSWMGVGVREAAYAVFFAPAFMSKEAAVLVGIVWFVGMTLASAIGGILAAISGDWAVIRKKGGDGAVN